MSDELNAAVAHGDDAVLQHCLDAGADPNRRDDRGETLLHLAVAGGQLDAAACLLAHGADPALPNRSGQLPLAPDLCRVDTLHGIRQRYHRRTFHPPTPKAPASDAARWAADLERDGIVKLPAFVPPDLLAVMHQEFDGFVRHLDAEVALGRGRYRHYEEEEHVWTDERALVSNNAFKHSRALTTLCGDAALVEAARLYVGVEPIIQRALAMRYLPCTVPEKDMFGWHHDMEDKRCKVMILLTDVAEEDQCMSYVLGSHKLLHPYLMFVRNACRLDYCRERMPEVRIYNAHGAAGDVFLFDTNGAHRGNRREFAAMRDVFLVEYSADASNVWGGDVDERVLRDLPDGAAKPFERLRSSPKRWLRPHTRRPPNWVATLPQIETWLDPASPAD